MYNRKKEMMQRTHGCGSNLQKIF